MTPMQETAGPISTRRKAKVTPTASASMLVATARGSMDRGRKELSTCSSPPRDSRIMFAPISPSRRKAIQWSTPAMIS